MQKKVLLLVGITFLLAGCFKPKGGSSNSSQSTSSGSGQTSSESIPSGGYGYGYYNNYYGQLTWNNGEDLKQKLHDIIRDGWTSLKYEGPNWETNTIADHTYDDYEYLDVVYSKDNVLASLTQTSWQREHVFAATLMTGKATGDAVKNLGRATDFHNLIAGGASGNQSRGNKNLGVANTTDPSYKNYTTDNGNDGYSYDPKTFEPGNKDKGRLARAIFYMGTMYKDDETEGSTSYKGLKIVEENVDYSAGNCQFAIGHLSELLNWNNTYSVDYLEMQHNESVYSHVYSKQDKAQGNRNPFVDYPGLVDYVYGSKQQEAGDLKDMKPACYDLDLYKEGVSHLAIKSAKRSYNYGETLASSDLIIYKVNKDFTFAEAGSADYTHSLINHTFSKDDGSSIEATITAGNQTIKYTIELDPIGGCSFNTEMKNNTISNTKVNQDQDIKFGTVDFLINIAATSGFTLQNNSKGGFKMGSNTNAVTRVTLTTKNSFKVDRAFISGYGANASATYSLSIKVGTTEIFSGTVQPGEAPTTFGSEMSSPLTGQISYTFTGGNALNLNFVAFNVVS